jgi:putative hydrolase of the HAD superfamily/pyrimidine and pyridine-specific 5'-nucleotidase
MDVQCVFFDLDDTLYDDGKRLQQRIVQNINRHCKDTLKLATRDGYPLRPHPGTPSPHLLPHRYNQFGTTLRGLQVSGFDLDVEAYLTAVHDLPLAEHLSADPSLRSELQAITVPTWVFTASCSEHADRCVSR